MAKDIVFGVIGLILSLLVVFMIVTNTDNNTRIEKELKQCIEKCDKYFCITKCEKLNIK